MNENFNSFQQEDRTLQGSVFQYCDRITEEINFKVGKGPREMAQWLKELI